MTMHIKNANDKPFDALGLGEVMLRLSPPARERISMGENFEKTVGGSELNVMCGISMLGLRTGIITKLPAHELGTYVQHRIRFAGVSDDYVVMDGDPQARLGLYYYEFGAHPRKPSVIYDRAASSFTTLHRDEIHEDMFASTRVFHVSGITMGLGKRSRDLSLELVRGFKKAGATISFDVNYRAALWGEEEAYLAMMGILPLVDILFVSEETSKRMLRRPGDEKAIMRGYHEEFGCAMVALTRRKVDSPTRHTWDSALYAADEDAFYSEAPYTDIEVVDRIGSGDAYLSGVLYGLLADLPPQRALEYGNAMAAIKNTVMGDMPASSLGEIQSVIGGHHGAFQSEMNR
jgi:2-dehydro-3-deoxygluconokinase